jgi:hypothetical protein
MEDINTIGVVQYAHHRRIDLIETKPLAFLNIKIYLRNFLLP